jgi:hypothetical protein
MLLLYEYLTVLAQQHIVNQSCLPDPDCTAHDDRVVPGLCRAFARVLAEHRKRLRVVHFDVVELHAHTLRLCVAGCRRNHVCSCGNAVALGTTRIPPSLCRTERGIKRRREGPLGHGQVCVARGKCKARVRCAGSWYHVQVFGAGVREEQITNKSAEEEGLLDVLLPEVRTVGLVMKDISA